MKHFNFFQACLLGAASVGLFCANVHAQDSDYARVVRLSRIEGQVLVSHAGSDAWEEALVNLPLQEGDTLATQNGLAEIEFENGATAYLAENSVLQFTQLTFSGAGRVTQLTLTQGAGTFYANLTKQDSFRVVTSTFEVAIPERAEVRVDAFRDGASLQVLQGSISVSTSAGSTEFEKGQSVTIHQGDLQKANIARLPEQDDFDQWVTGQSEMIQSGNQSSLSYISSPNYYGLSDLSIYGTWVNVPGYGNSWRPFSLGFSWTPYLNGIWKLDPRLGWIWVSNEPWGWMPYHFGGWVLSPTLGWVWVPGGPSGLRHWQPARVNWVHVGNQVGWVAMSPNDREGAPANLGQGVITKPGVLARSIGDSNQIIAGKELRDVTPLKQPPADFASRPARGALRPGFTSTGLTVPQPSNRPLGSSDTIVFDHKTRTFINGNGGNGRNREDTPVIPAGAILPSGARTEIPRVIIPPPGRMDSQVNRVIVTPSQQAPLTPQMPAMPSRILMNGVNRPANTIPAPLSARPAFSSQPSQAAPPRPVTSPSAPHQTAPTPQMGSVVRSTMPPQRAQPPAGAGTQRH